MSKDTTREKILAAASNVFSTKGYEKTTVRDICAEAEVNVAAVNYHFRDKQNLFYKVLALWMQEYVENSGLIGLIDAAETPEEKIRTYIHSELSFICREYDPEGLQLNRARLILQELTADDHDPTIFECHKAVEEKMLFPVVKQLIGNNEDPEIMKAACIATTSMTTHYFLMALDDPKFMPQTVADLDNSANFLTAFALGGLKAIKEKYNA